MSGSGSGVCLSPSVWVCVNMGVCLSVLCKCVRV